MPIIDSTYFKNTNIVANVSEPGVSGAINEELNAQILKGERDVLSYAFGWEMWEDFKQYISNGIALNTPQKYLNVINGKQYEIDGKKCFWQGLIEPQTKESLLADYVYCTYRQNNDTITTASGDKQIDTKVGDSISNIPKVTRVWNQFIEKLHGGFRSNPDGFTIEGNPYWLINGARDYYGVYRKNGPVSLVQFLFDNKADYPLLDQNFRRFGEFKNELGI
ncbi:hypothetical protein [Chryseobacterium mucoviscidosis]|uniref:hypothetical protein n=1 Tax=Chryseobacterium mucoviscidosis TaxID=1945581 RepID=UPI003016D9AE